MKKSYDRIFPDIDIVEPVIIYEERQWLKRKRLQTIWLVVIIVI